MKIRHIIMTALLLSLAAGMSAQTTDEILAKMETELAKGQEQGMAFDLEMSIPIIGKFRTRSYIHDDDHYKMVLEKNGEKSISWYDKTTSWTYDSRKNEIKIENKKTDASGSSANSDAKDNLGMMSGVTEGYDVKLKKQDEKAWYFDCKKSKSNKDKDDPKTMTLIIAKDTYLPISVKAKAGLIGIAMENFALGVTSEDVTFDASKYPGATIVDAR